MPLRPSPRHWISRRRFLGRSLAAGIALGTSARGAGLPLRAARPLNVVYVFADQWRAQATGYAGDPNVKTPHLDQLAGQALNFTTAVATCPVCSPNRASLLTGQYPLTHGVFINDVHLDSRSTSIGKVFRDAGYATAYIGKWHVNGRGRLSYIPREDRQGFDFWAACECTHDYNRSVYYGDENRRLTWQGYDAEAQTGMAQQYLRDRARDAQPFLLMLSWGPPHNPYETAPARFRALYDPQKLQLRPNVPPASERQARRDLAGYYAHCSALDNYVGDLLAVLRETGLEEHTVFAFSSDHGDMLGSHGEQRKQRPWDESILVPLLVRCPALFGSEARTIATPFGIPDTMPTLLGLCELPVPTGVEGADLSATLLGRAGPQPEGALIACYAPFGEWTRSSGGREYRGVRTERYTYVRDRSGPWLLFDNRADPYQGRNLVDQPEQAPVRQRLDAMLQAMLKRQRDGFLSGWDYIRQRGYEVDATGTAPTRP